MKLKTEKLAKDFIRETKFSNVFEAVSETDFVLDEGTLAEIEGRSGSGKSTFLNLACGLLKPSRGSVIVGEKSLYSLDDDSLSKFRNENFGIIPQLSAALPSLTVSENILLPCTIYNENNLPLEYAEELMQKLDIASLENAYPEELSGGELRRLCIARALIKKPPFVFADEPTADLDDENTEAVLKLLKDYSERGNAVLLVTHESSARNYADKVYKMTSGRLHGNKF